MVKELLLQATHNIVFGANGAVPLVSMRMRGQEGWPWNPRLIFCRNARLRVRLATHSNPHGTRLILCGDGQRLTDLIDIFLRIFSNMKKFAFTRAQQLPQILEDRLVILDGAMGTMIQQLKLTEAQFRGELYKSFHKEVKGNNELLNLTQPQLISDIHERYLIAGADIIETNTFGATRIAQADYDMQDFVRKMNIVAARLARNACDKFATPEKPRFVAGSIGPTPKTASISPDVNDPAARNVDFETLREAYLEQVEGLAEGGVDLLLIETVFDTLNAKAALFAIDEFFEASGERLPIMISGTVTDASGRLLSGQTVTAFWHSVRHAQPLAVGLDCALGAALMRPYIQELARVASDTFIGCHPNAGLPNPMSETGFDETPEVTSRLLREFAAEGLVNIVGGCCGTTPAHINAIADAMVPFKPRGVQTIGFYPACF